MDSVAKLLPDENIIISLLKSTSFSTAECQGVSYGREVQNKVLGDWEHHQGLNSVFAIFRVVALVSDLIFL